VLLAVIAGTGPVTYIRDTAEQSPAGEHSTGRSRRRSTQPPSEQDLRAWAAALASALPQLTEPQVAAVARLAAHLDANDNRELAA
jgi:hypothetical protein